ncbi:hypothetical protein HPP92_009400 [Vanilla planifolia]|uniref:Beta-carotene isomerase D27-like C-terminal domain-containing protein n=1 Tax=Vanilla planifolia TaxID=51239 RepID=A0A835RFS6_VANPL|nr:hypothetical protein HPP92_009400 [Vanilla planifolia]
MCSPSSSPHNNIHKMCMKTCLLLHHGRSLTPLRAIPWPTHEPPMRTHHPFVVLAKAKGAHLPTIHVDGWFARLAIAQLSRKERLKEGYEGLVEAAAIIARRNTVEEQQEMVEEALKKAFPQALLSLIRAIVPSSKFSREFFAMFTTMFFSWLVGHCEVKEAQFQEKRERNVVYIPKCRFLEATNCAGMCTNLCKLPSQKFIRESLGMPTYMVPSKLSTLP